MNNKTSQKGLLLYSLKKVFTVHWDFYSWGESILNIPNVTAKNVIEGRFRTCGWEDVVASDLVVSVSW